MTHLRRALPLALAALLAGPFAATAAADTYVSNRGGAEILVFADGATGNVAPLRVISGPATQITPGNLNGIAFDAENGEIFVSLGTSRILVFDAAANGNVAPLRRSDRSRQSRPPRSEAGPSYCGAEGILASARSSLARCRSPTDPGPVSSPSSSRTR